MTLYPYTLDTPFPTDTPAADQPNMRINTNSISGIIGQDHVGFTFVNGGYHNVIHFNTQGADPVAVATIGELYTKSSTFNATTDAGLFYENGAGVVTQILAPANTNPSAALAGPQSISNGYTFLPGGIIIQFGNAAIVAGSPSTTPVVFTIPFTNVFMVMAQPVTGQLIKVNGLTYATSAQSKTGFNFLCYNPVALNNFDWFAIGN